MSCLTAVGARDREWFPGVLPDSPWPTPAAAGLAVWPQALPDREWINSCNVVIENSFSRKRFTQDFRVDEVVEYSKCTLGTSQGHEIINHAAGSITNVEADHSESRCTGCVPDVRNIPRGNDEQTCLLAAESVDTGEGRQARAWKSANQVAVLAARTLPIHPATDARIVIPRCPPSPFPQALVGICAAIRCAQA